MRPMPLSKTNPYLKTPAMRKMMVARSVKTSGGVEGIMVTVASKASKIKIPRRKKRIYARLRLIAQAK